MAAKEIDTKRRYVRPVGDISEDAGIVYLRLEMPGVTKNGLSVNIEGDQLLISGTRETRQLDGTYHIRERVSNDFYQTFTLDETVDREKVDAELKQGILTVKLHLKESVKPRRINVQAG